MKIHWDVVAKVKGLFFSKEKPEVGNARNPFMEFDYNGSNDEVFFDSKAWLDSDCEDDFYSVNGDFTPSRGSTPNYQISALTTSQLNKATYFDTDPDAKSEPSPTERKTKLADLLRDNQLGEMTEENTFIRERETNGKTAVHTTNNNRSPKSWNGSPPLSDVNSVYSREVTADSNYKCRKGKTGKAKNCCLPSFSHTLGFNDRRKQKMSPGH